MTEEVKRYASLLRTAHANTAAEKLVFIEAADLMEELTEALKGAHAVCEVARQELEKVKAERDAVIDDLKDAIEHGEGINYCSYCKHSEEDGQCHHPCNPYAEGETGWEWRGLMEEIPKGEQHEK